MEDIINQLPKYIDNFQGERFYLTIGASDNYHNGWQAAYIDREGRGTAILIGEGESALASLLDLQANMHIVALINRPAINATEDGFLPPAEDRHLPPQN